MKYILGITLSLFLFVACGSNSASDQADAGTDTTQPETKVTHMTPQEFQMKIAELGNPQIVDVRTAGELEGGFIENSTHIDIQSSDFGDKIAGLNKEQPVMVYCAAGGRSKKACNSMKDWGFKEIYELDNGFGGWQSAGLPVVNQ